MAPLILIELAWPLIQVALGCAAICLAVGILTIAWDNS